jgi:hypothetical protein
LGVFTINTTELEKEVPMGTPLKNLIIRIAGIHCGHRVSVYEAVGDSEG